MLLVLDNLQWCDQETLTFLTFCLGLDPAAQILVAGTLRDDDPGEDPDLADWTARMRASGLLAELSLNPLEAADTARLAEAISGAPSSRPTRTCSRRRREVSRCTSSRPCAAVSISAAAGCPSVISRRCCATALTR